MRSKFAGLPVELFSEGGALGETGWTAWWGAERRPEDDAGGDGAGLAARPLPLPRMRPPPSFRADMALGDVRL